MVLHRGIHKKFKTILDRSGNNSEELLPKIDQALDHIRKIEDHTIFPIIDSYELNRTEKSLDTSFTYHLESVDQYKFADAGIKDLINTLPVTLVYLPKIKFVEVIHEVDGTHTSYVSHHHEKTEEVTKFSVEIFKNGFSDPTTYNFITYQNDDVSLAVQVKAFDNMELVMQESRNPRLYRDFPLIGSQKFYFPFILNGFKFNPTEDRDGILIHSKDAMDAIQNRKIIESSYLAAKEFTQWLLDQGSKNLFILALSRLPEENWIDFSKNWIEGLIKDYRLFIFQSSLVETDCDGAIIPLNEAIIPNYGNSHYSKTSFYQLVRFFKGGAKVPAENLILNWIDFVGPQTEENLWPKQIYYGIKKLLQEFSAIGNLQKFTQENDKSEEEIIRWLNSLIVFLQENKETELLNEYAVIPNQHGEFKLVSQLNLEENNDPIDDLFLDFAASLKLDWRNELIHRGIKLENISVSKRGLSNLSEKINEILKEKVHLPNNTFTSKFLEREDALERLVQLLKIVGDDARYDSFRNSIFQFGKDIFGFEDTPLKIKHISSFHFENALRLFIEVVNKKIESLINLKGLSDQLNINLADTCHWINDYLILLKGKSDFEHFLKVGNIVPNRYGEFYAFEKLKNYGTTDFPLSEELLDILLKLDPREDWRSELVHECITFQMNQTLKFEELGNRIQEIIFQLQKEDLSEPDMGHLDKYSDCILDLIEWTENDDRAEKFLKSFKEKSQELFFRLTMKGSNISVQEIKMLADPKMRSVMHAISNSSLSLNEILELIKKVDSLGSVSLLLKYADDLVAEEQNRKWLQKIGEEIEGTFRKALENDFFEFRLNYQGIGSYDFKISNSHNGREFFIELKSFAMGSERPLRFAPSQAERALRTKDNFAISLIERPNDREVSTDFIRANTRSILDAAPFFKTGYEDYLIFRSIDSKDVNSDSKLRLVLLEKERIEISKALLMNNSVSFENLVNRIKSYLVPNAD